MKSKFFLTTFFTFTFFLYCFSQSKVSQNAAADSIKKLSFLAGNWSGTGKWFKYGAATGDTSWFRYIILQDSIGNINMDVYEKDNIADTMRHLLTSVFSYDSYEKKFTDNDFIEGKLLLTMDVSFLNNYTIKLINTPNEDQRSTIIVQNNEMIETQEEIFNNTWTKTLEVHLVNKPFATY